MNNADYQPPFKFTGRLKRITLMVDRLKLSPEDFRKLQAVERDAAINSRRPM